MYTGSGVARMLIQWGREWEWNRSCQISRQIPQYFLRPVSTYCMSEKATLDLQVPSVFIVLSVVYCGEFMYTMFQLCLKDDALVTVWRGPLEKSVCSEQGFIFSSSIQVTCSEESVDHARSDIRYPGMHSREVHRGTIFITSRSLWALVSNRLARWTHSRILVQPEASCIKGLVLPSRNSSIDKATRHHTFRQDHYY